jgi:hypothetical protein
MNLPLLAEPCGQNDIKMEDFKIKKALKNNFDDYEISPKEELFAHIANTVSKSYKADKQANRYRIAKYLSLAALLFTIGTVTYLYNSDLGNISNNQSEETELSGKNIPKIAINFESKNDNTATNKLKIKENLSEKSVEKANYLAISTTENIESTNDKTNYNLLNKKLNQSKTTRIVNFSKPNQSQTLSKFEENNTFDKTQINELNGNIATQNLAKNAIGFSEKFGKNRVNNSSEIGSEIFSNKILMANSANSNLNFLNSKSFSIIDNPLNKRELPINLRNKVPKKELPKINKTTPLAIEFSINPFYAFQKIEPTAAGLANIQNISTGKINPKQRLGLAINAGYVINWTKQSRLRLGVSYRDIFQKVGYELATDTYEFQTINGNQTVLVRKGIPYAEEKRNQLIGIKADRQFFLQLSTPTRFYASLGAEYTKALKSKTQMVFVNTTMGIDCPIGLKTKLQIEPSYSYALLGTTDALKNVSINPNHIGLRIGVLYEIRK